MFSVEDQVEIDQQPNNRAHRLGQQTRNEKNTPPTIAIGLCHTKKKRVFYKQTKSQKYWRKTARRVCLWGSNSPKVQTIEVDGKI